MPSCHGMSAYPPSSCCTQPHPHAPDELHFSQKSPLYATLGEVVIFAGVCGKPLPIVVKLRAGFQRRSQKRFRHGGILQQAATANAAASEPTTWHGPWSAAGVVELRQGIVPLFYDSEVS